MLIKAIAAITAGQRASRPGRALSAEPVAADKTENMLLRSSWMGVAHPIILEKNLPIIRANAGNALFQCDSENSKNIVVIHMPMKFHRGTWFAAGHAECGPSGQSW
ncbi:MAG: hypothetical protein HOM58_18215 [Rhodospirillaceae bacterium]|nr:hypothetical protein [Rhodospirillaceae bacterium]MBT5458853.1 hypothetical protein [Rhodospirillaceae bacterium]